MYNSVTHRLHVWAGVLVPVCPGAGADHAQVPAAGLLLLLPRRLHLGVRGQPQRGRQED